MPDHRPCLAEKTGLVSKIAAWLQRQEATESAQMEKSVRWHRRTTKCPRIGLRRGFFVSMGAHARRQGLRNASRRRP